MCFVHIWSQQNSQNGNRMKTERGDTFFDIRVENKQSCKQTVYKEKIHKQTNNFSSQHSYAPIHAIRINIHWELREEIHFLWNVSKINKVVNKLFTKWNFDKQSDKFCALYIYEANRTVRMEIGWKLREEIRFSTYVWKINKVVNKLFTKKKSINKPITFLPSTHMHPSMQSESISIENWGRRYTFCEMSQK